MEELLKELEEQWKKIEVYQDVKAISWTPEIEREEKCSEGCDLEIYEKPKNWENVENRDVLRQTRICREHGYARIYFISGPTRKAINWTPEDDK